MLWVLQLIAIWLGLLPAPDIAVLRSRFSIDRLEIAPAIHRFLENGTKPGGMAQCSSLKLKLKADS